MPATTASQARIFLFLMLAGGLGGALYGVLSLARRLLAPGCVVGALIDGAAGFLLCALYTVALYVACDGALRLYALLALALGFALERGTLGWLVGRAVRAAAPALSRGLQRLSAMPALRKIFR